MSDITVSHIKGTTKVETTNHGNVLTSEEKELVLGLVRVEGVPAVVRVSLGDTVNLGNYNGVRAEVSISLPLVPNDTEVEAGYTRAVSWVERKLKAVLERGMKDHPNYQSGSSNGSSDFPYG